MSEFELDVAAAHARQAGSNLGRTGDIDAYWHATMPQNPDSYIGLEHCKALVSDMTPNAITNGFKGFLLDAEAPDVLDRPRSYYDGTVQQALKDYLPKLRCTPLPSDGYWAMHNSYVVNETCRLPLSEARRRKVTIVHPDTTDYLLRTGYIIDTAPELVRRIENKEIYMLGKTAAVAALKIAESVSAQFL